MEVGRHPRPGGERGRRRLYTRTGDDISKSFPDVVDALSAEGVIDGELLVMRDGQVASFADLQQRLNRKTVDAKALANFPAAIRAYDLLAEGAEDTRILPFGERRKRLEAFVAKEASPRIDLSPMQPFETWAELSALRADPPAGDPQIAEGLMLKRWDSIYEAGRPKGPWFKWKRDPFLIDAVLMYAQRGHGKRSSFYSDYTFGVWTDGEGGHRVLTPVGKAYFGFTDEELKFSPRRAPLGPGVRGGLRGPATLDPPQVRRRHALPADKPHPLGQAAWRSRRTGDARADARSDGRALGLQVIPSGTPLVIGGAAHRPARAWTT
jgi:ATP-dependent DNA ligase